MSKIDLGSDKVVGNFFRLAVPAILAQFVTILYQAVDRVFIGQLPDGMLAMAGIGVTMPITMLIAAFSVLVGSGGGALVAIYMGKQQQPKAEQIMGNGFSLLLMFSVFLTAIFSFSLIPMLEMLGVSSEILPYASDYLRIYLYGTLFVQIALGMNSFITTQGFAKIGMVTVMIGCFANIILDPIFIFGLNMGVKGAAWATVLSQLLSCIWTLQFLFGRKTQIKFHLKNLVLNITAVLEILQLGSSAFIMRSVQSVIILVFNQQLGRFGGDLGIAAMTIMNTFLIIGESPVVGLCQGAQPILGYNFGGGKMQNVKKTIKVLFSCCTGFTVAFFCILNLFPAFFAGIFTTDSQLLELTILSMRIYLLGLLASGIQIACQQSFIAFGKAKQASTIALVKKVGITIPLLYLLPWLFPEYSYWALLAVQPLTDLLATLLTTVLFGRFYKKIMTIHKAG